MEEKDHWIQTYSKVKFSFTKPSPDNVNIIDIAHSLSQQVRFVGHLQRPLSLAQHCLMVCAALQKEGQSPTVCLQGLLHDAHEAYIGDISKPLKWHLEANFNIHWDSIEEPIKAIIGEKFGVDLVELPGIVNDFDEACLRTEAESLFERVVDNWTHYIPLKLAKSISVVLGCEEAKGLYIETYKQLKSKIN